VVRQNRDCWRCANANDQDNGVDVSSIIAADANTKLLQKLGTAGAKLGGNMQQVKVTDMGGSNAVDMELSNSSSIIIE
jgi:hypothetical protein